MSQLALYGAVGTLQCAYCAMGLAPAFAELLASELTVPT